MIISNGQLVASALARYVGWLLVWALRHSYACMSPLSLSLLCWMAHRWNKEFLAANLGDTNVFDIYSSKNNLNFRYYDDVRHIVREHGLAHPMPRHHQHQHRHHGQQQQEKNQGNYSYPSPTTRQKLSFQEFLRLLHENGPEKGDRTYYYMQQTLYEGVGRAIVEDVSSFNWPWLRSIQIAHALQFGPLKSNVVWIGPSGVVTPAHFDEAHNFFCQVRAFARAQCHALSHPYHRVDISLALASNDTQPHAACTLARCSILSQIEGSKRFALFHPEQYCSFYPFPIHHPCDRQSQVNLYKPNLEYYPRFAEAAALIATVQRGDVLYLPPFWWYVRRACSLLPRQLLTRRLGRVAGTMSKPSKVRTLDSMHRLATVPVSLPAMNAFINQCSGVAVDRQTRSVSTFGSKCRRPTLRRSSIHSHHNNTSRFAAMSSVSLAK